MKTHIIFNGYQGATPYQSFTLRGISERTATTNIGNVKKTNRLMRTMSEREKAENEMNRVLSLAHRQERTQARKDKFNKLRNKIK
jgi:hypothetical protein